MVYHNIIQFFNRSGIRAIWTDLFHALRKNHLLFWILPLAHLIMALVIRQFLGYFFLTSTDPEYFHLISGIALADFHPNAGYMDHPGTPLQLIIAAAAWLVYAISGSEGLLQDAVTRPELYLFAAVVLLNILSSLVMFYIGKKAFAYSRDYWLALSLQLGFFSSPAVLEVSSRIFPENIMMLPLGLMVLFLLRHLFAGKQSNKAGTPLLFGILMGFGIASKLSFAAFFPVALFILPAIRDKLKYLGFSLLFFFVFAFPVLTNLFDFLDWGGNMFVHSGKWGGGDKTIIDFRLFPQHFRELFQYDSALFYAAGMLLLTTIPVFLLRKKDAFLQRYAQISFGLLSGFILLVLMICKHFAWHYLVPAIMLKMVFIVLILLLPAWFLRSRPYLRHIQLLGTMLAAFFVFHATGKYAAKVARTPVDEQVNRMAAFQQQLQTEDKLIIRGHYSGSPFRAWSLAGGYWTVGYVKSIFDEALKHQYPNQFIFYDWADEGLFHWEQDFVPARKALSKKGRTLIFTGIEQEAFARQILERIRREVPEKSFQLEEILHYQPTGERLYQLIEK